MTEGGDFMRYVFFDIECADGGKGSICSFGYVITDEHFRELESADIIINPDSRFYLVGRSKRPDIILSYSEAEFRKAPKFPVFYPKIKAMLEAKDQIVVGHSVQDDVNFLCKACARYALSPLQFHFVDSQSLYSAAYDSVGQLGLDRACEIFSIPKPQDVHNSEADARATMLLVKAICENKKIDLKEYRREHRIWGETQDFKIYCSYIHPNRTMFQNFLEKVAPKQKREQVLKNKKVCVSMAIEQPRQAQIYHLVQNIVDAGGSYTRVASECDMFVTANAEPGRICKRTKTAKEAKRGGHHIEMIALDDFLQKLGIEKTEYQKMPLPDIHWI